MSHALFSPSAASRWLVCPLTATLSAKFVDTQTAASANGTLHHEIAADLLERDKDAKDAKMQLYLDAVREVPGQLYVESKITIIPGVCWGTSDAYVVAPDKLTVFDLKWGKSMVHATRNPQLRTYGVGVLRENPMPRDTPVELVIVQPNATTGWPVKRWETTVDELLEFRQEIIIAVERSMAPDPVGVPGPHCYWCPGKLHCVEYLKNHARK